MFRLVSVLSVCWPSKDLLFGFRVDHQLEGSDEWGPTRKEFLSLLTRVLRIHMCRHVMILNGTWKGKSAVLGFLKDHFPLPREICSNSLTHYTHARVPVQGMASRTGTRGGWETGNWPLIICLGGRETEQRVDFARTQEERPELMHYCGGCFACEGLELAWDRG